MRPRAHVNPTLPTLVLSPRPLCRRRAVRINAKVVKAYLRDANKLPNFTRPMPLPDMVQLLNEVWDEEAITPVPGMGHGTIPTPSTPPVFLR